MFDRIKYKKFAKIQLKKRWTLPVLITLFCTIIISLLNIPDTSQQLVKFSDIMSEHGFNLTITSMIPQPTGWLLYTYQLCSFLAILITAILEIAQIKFYLKMSLSPEPVSFGDFIEGFSLWARGILASLWVSLWTIIWTCLFIIPGIVKAYAYSMTLYLVAENQELSITKALKVSMAITKGHKMDLFILDLSFIGWSILCCFTAGIGYLWLVPYIQMTKVNAYHALLKEALTTGLITTEDLKD